MPARRSSSQLSFLNPHSLLVLMSTTTREMVLGSSTWVTAGMGKITLPWTQGAYLPNLSFLESSGLFLVIYFPGDWRFCIVLFVFFWPLPWLVGADRKSCVIERRDWGSWPFVVIAGCLFFRSSWEAFPGWLERLRGGPKKVLIAFKVCSFYRWCLHGFGRQPGCFCFEEETAV